MTTVVKQVFVDDLGNEFNVTAPTIHLKLDGTLQRDITTGALGVNPAALPPSGTVVEQATGQVDVTIGTITGNAVRVIPEQPAIAEATDTVNDLVTIYNVSTGRHEKVPLNQLGLATLANNDLGHGHGAHVDPKHDHHSAGE